MKDLFNTTEKWMKLRINVIYKQCKDFLKAFRYFFKEQHMVNEAFMFQFSEFSEKN